MFILHTQLLQDTYYIGKLPLSRVLLMNNKLFPWVILVPEIENKTELFELQAKEQKMLIEETSAIAKAIKKLYWADKMNIATLGNQVEQLHIHIIARFKTDECWPAPVWGKGIKQYDEKSAEETINKIRDICANLKGFNAIANIP